MTRTRLYDWLGGAWHRTARHVADVAFLVSLGDAGRRVHGVGEARRYERHRTLVDRYSLDVRTVLYIGANEGQDLRVLRAAYPLAAIHCFEPQPDVARRLSVVADGLERVTVHPIALGDASRPMVMSTPDNSQAASLRQPKAAFAQHFPRIAGWSSIQVDVTTLDEWAASQTLSDDLLIKLDVQGYEDMVMAGGAVTCRRARAVITEPAVVPTYEGAPSWAGMLSALSREGFVYAGEMEQVHEVTRAVVEFDGPFIRPRRS